MTRDKLIRNTLATLVATVVYKGLFALAHHPISWLLATMLGLIMYSAAFYSSATGRQIARQRWPHILVGF
ncbi:hypothetical protein DL991_41320 [Amycolatopsis sp. WAC 01375]|uniref:hypothetical protein n=1 Tax=Amycolatopsis sp. WAC 01375 TaxID=2203194 RepID=UPI000F7B1282|nr:hypothetical protein [Amycolatopsis sp. WAC 01375]RSM68711.1 hypothetical protein DL991_41320 [Amycolatopsis sp. WAC 01375]